MCPLQEVARKVASLFQAKVYSYVASHGRSGPETTEAAAENGGKKWSDGIADSTSDVEAILGVYNATTDADEKFVRNLQDLFYGYVRQGALTRGGDKDALAAVYVVGADDDVATLAHYPNCDFWKSAQNIVPDYADFN